MVDNRQNTNVTMRTPRARVKGLGASGPLTSSFNLDFNVAGEVEGDNHSTTQILRSL